MVEGLRPIELIYLYAQPDEKWCSTIDTHLSQLVKQQQVAIWHKQMIIAGHNHLQEINAHVSTAQIILLLISPDFLASEYYSSIQIDGVMARHKVQSACVIPILLRPSDWQSTPFADLGPLPSDHLPVSRYRNQDEAWVDVAQGIRRVVEEIRTRSVVQHEERSIEQKQEHQPLSISGQERPATVFLDYASEDTETVRDLQLRLNVRGIRSWHDVDNLLSGSLIKHERIHAIKHDVDAFAILLTPDSLLSNDIWQIDVPAALHRYERDPQFPIIIILQGVSLAEVQQCCYKHNLENLSRFRRIELINDKAMKVTEEEQHTKRNEAAKCILRATLSQHLRRVNADHNYELSLALKTFASQPSVPRLDLDLDWLKLVNEKKRLATIQEWEQILLPALLDVKQSINEIVFSRRIHLFVTSILPIAIALGFTFRESARITLLLEGQSETWSTNVSPSEKDPLLREWISYDQGDQKIAVVEVTTTKRSISQAVEENLLASGLTPGYHIRLESSDLIGKTVRDAAHAQAIAQQVGRVCQDLCDQRRVKHIHLFVSTPVELAVLIGHQFNALSPITLYEYTNNMYIPIGTIRSA